MRVFTDEGTLDALAREILMVDANGEPLAPRYTKIMEHGLSGPPPDPERKDVLILGAGIAGLLAGRILKKSGYNVTIVEANDSRVGGRIKTFHAVPDGEPPFQDPLQYAEAGAMRIPSNHVLVTRLIELMGLGGKMRTFYNVDVEKDGDGKTKAWRAWLHANGLTARRGTADANQVGMGFPVPERYRTTTANALLTAALKEPVALTSPTGPDGKPRPIAEQIDGWKTVLRKYDQFSMLRYLREFGYDEVTIQYIGMFQNLTSRLFLSFIHSFVDTFYINTTTVYKELEGGNWQLPYALLPDLRENVVMDSRAVEIQWPGAGAAAGPKALHRGRPGVYVRAINEPIVKRGVVRRDRARVEREFTADHLILTIPFSALRFVDVQPLFSYWKRRAVMELHYDSATKVLLEFSERFWEWSAAEWRDHLGSEYRGHDAYGGASFSDGPNRFIYFPSHKVEGSRGGVVLASYVWADEANRWDSIPSADRYTYALQGLTAIYGSGIARFFTGFGKTESWMENYYSFGEAAVFSPGQLTTLHPHIERPEGVVHFAGEHASLKHAWIEGALESAVRAALEIHEGTTKS